MYSFAQRSDTRVIDEPMYAYYLESTKADHPGKEEVLATQSSDIERVIRDVILGDYEQQVLFIKNMAHHMKGVGKTFMSRLINLFLIRDPHEMLTSFIKTMPNPTMQDVAYKKQHELFEYVTGKLGQAPIVIDSRELLKNPPEVLRKLCDKIGIAFEDTMLKWEKGPLPEDGVWAKYWYYNVHKSTGFMSYRPKQEDVPGRLSDLLEECLDYYNDLARYAIKA